MDSTEFVAQVTLLKGATHTIVGVSERLLHLNISVPAGVTQAELDAIKALENAATQFQIVLYGTPDPTTAPTSLPPPPPMPGSGGRTVAVGAGQPFATFAAAIASLDATLGGTITAQGTFAESFLVDRPLTIRASGALKFDVTTLPGLIWGDQAIIVNTADLQLDGGAIGIEMMGAMKQSSNACTVRPYLGTTTYLRRVKIHDCADGILTNPQIKALYLFDCEVSRCSADDQSHLIYVGTGAGLFHAERTAFHDPLDAGNFVKSRALVTELVTCAIGNATSTRGSKLVDACEGGRVTIAGGTWEKPAGADDSHVLFGYAAENKNAGDIGASIAGVTIKSGCTLPIVLNWGAKPTVFSSCIFAGPNKVMATGSVGPVIGLPA